MPTRIPPKIYSINQSFITILDLFTFLYFYSRPRLSIPSNDFFTSDKIWELQLGLEGFEERLGRWRQVLAVLGDKAKAVNYFDCAGAASVVVGIRADKDGQK